MKRNTRTLARRLFPTWTRRKQAEWTLARMRVDRGTYRFPIGERHVDIYFPEFLRKLPFGPPIEIVDTPYDLRMKGQHAIRAIFGRRE